MAEPYTDDDDFLDLCDETSSPIPDPGLLSRSPELLSQMKRFERAEENDYPSLEDYSDVETEDNSVTTLQDKDCKLKVSKSITIGGQHDGIKSVVFISDESVNDICKPKTHKNSEISPVKRRSIQVDSSEYEMSSTKKVRIDDRFDIRKNLSRKEKTPNYSHRKDKLGKLDCDEDNCLTAKSVFVKAAIKLKEMFPDRSASEIGEKIKKVNNGDMSENSIIQHVVDLICSSPDDNTDNNQDTLERNQDNKYESKKTSDDIQIALANPKLQVTQSSEYTCTVISKAKNQLSNRAKGKGIMKKVPIHTDEMDFEMDIDGHADFDDVEDLAKIPSPVTRPEIKSKLNTVKLHWTLIDSPKFSTNDVNLRYVIEIQAPPCKDWTTLGRNVAGNVYEISNLKPKQDYQFRVRASTRFGEISEPSPVAALCRSLGRQETTSDNDNVNHLSEEIFDSPEPQNLEDYSWFHGNKTRDEAEQLLFEAMDGQYLVRQNDKGILCLSLHSNGVVKHYKITKEPDGQVFISGAIKFKSISEVITYYSIHGELAAQLKVFLPKDQDGVVQAKSNTGRDAVEVSSTTLLCEGCGTVTTCDKMVQCCDGHLNCSSCVEKVVKKVLSVESEETNISCCYDEAFNCVSYIPESQAKKVLPSLIFELLEEKLNKIASEAIAKMTDVFSCPSCTNKFIIEGNVQEVYCPQCKMASCRYCMKKWNSMSHSNCSINKMMISSTEMETSNDWCTVPEGNQDFVAVNVSADSKEFQFVCSMFRGDHRRNGCKETIRKVYHIRNPKLWQKYSLTKDHMVKDIGYDNLNEQHLFHGTSTSAVGGICRDGLDWRMCGVNGTAYGQGTYFAKNSNYSRTYCQKVKGQLPGKGTPMFRFGNVQPVHSSLFSLQAVHGFGGFSTPGSNNNQAGPFMFGGGYTNTASNNSQAGPFMFGGGHTNTASNNSQAGPFMFGVSHTNTALNNSQAGPFAFGVPSNKPIFGAIQVNNFGHTGASFGPTVPNNAGTKKRKRFNDTQEDSFNTQSTEIPLEELFIDNDMGYMFLARVLVGRPCRGQHGLRKPPRDDNNRPYNSACDKQTNASIFVIFDSAQCYPEYLIEFESS